MGINPPAVDSDMVHYANPKALIRHLSRWKRAQERRRQESRSWREAQSRINSLWRRILGIRNNAHHQFSKLLVRKYQVPAIEIPQRYRHGQAALPSESGPVRPHRQAAAPDEVQSGLVRDTGRGSCPVVSFQQDLFELRLHQQGIEKGTSLDLPGVPRGPRTKRECSPQPVGAGPRSGHGPLSRTRMQAVDEDHASNPGAQLQQECCTQ